MCLPVKTGLNPFRLATGPHHPHAGRKVLFFELEHVVEAGRKALKPTRIRSNPPLPRQEESWGSETEVRGAKVAG